MAGAPISLKKDWVLNQAAFDALLATLDRDRQRAGEKYEHIRTALITFFECRGSTTPEDLADDTINRVARRLLEGRSIHVENPVSYFYGVARNVLKEYWDSRVRTAAPLENSAVALRAPDPHRLQEQLSARRVKEQALDCLERCLETLPPNDREFIAEYYWGETGVKIKNRQRLAHRLGIHKNALRIRALRIREKLEACVERCLGGPARE